jgi:hypothetical protein
MCPLKAIRFILDHVRMFLSSSVLGQVELEYDHTSCGNKESNVRERTVHFLHAFNDFFVCTKVEVAMAWSVQGLVKGFKERGIVGGCPGGNNRVLYSAELLGIASRYGLKGPGIESRWGRYFPHPSRPALRPTQPPTQCGSKAARAWR